MSPSAPAHRQAGLVGRGGRPRPADRHRPLLRHLRQCAGRLHGLHRPAQPARRWRRAPWGTDFPPVTIRDMVRAQKMLIDHLGIARLFAVIGGSMGGMQVLQWAASYPDAVFAALPIASRRLSLGAEHRLPRGRAAGDLRRSGLAGRPLLAERADPGARPGGGADVRAHHLSVRGGADPEVRPPAAERAEGPAARRSACSARCSRWRATCATRAAPSCSASTPIRYLTITRAMDYFDLAADYDGDLADCVPRHEDAVPAGVVHLGLAVSRPRRAARSRGR